MLTPPQGAWGERFLFLALFALSLFLHPMTRADLDYS